MMAVEWRGGSIRATRWREQAGEGGEEDAGKGRVWAESHLLCYVGRKHNEPAGLTPLLGVAKARPLRPEGDRPVPRQTRGPTELTVFLAAPAAA